MKNLSTGTGLALLATAIVAYPFVNRISSVDQTAHASVPVAAIAAAATAQANPEPTVVWMGVYHDGYSTAVYNRLWSDGRLEARSVSPRIELPSSSAGCGFPQLMGFGCSSPWIEVPPPPAGNGFACRSDLNGDRTVDGADLSFILANWGPQQPCEPEATYPCMTIAGDGLMR
jgi:hypothetical protein